MLQIVSFNTINVLNKMELFTVENNINFPSLYAIFLQKYNGGYTPKTSFDLNGISSDIRCFYGFDENDEDSYFPLLVEFDDFINCIDNDLLPIATDSLGNLIVIGINQYNNGQIYFLDNETNKLSFLSSDFKNFISKINSQPFIVDSIEKRIQKLIDSDSNISVNDGLLKLWQDEIDKYSNLNQQIVNI